MPRCPGSRRSAQRHDRRLYVVRDALLSLVASARLAGPSLDFLARHSKRKFLFLLSSSTKRARAFPFAHLSNIVCARDIFCIPGWAKALYLSTSQASSVAVSTVWTRLLAEARRYRRRIRGSSAGLSGKLLSEYLSFSGYSFSKLRKEKLVAPLRAGAISLPPFGHTPQPLSRFLRPPFSEMFSERGFACLVDEMKLPLVGAVPIYDSFASEEDRFKIYKELPRRGMMTFRRGSDPPCVTNGMFGLTKPSGLLRLLVDMRKGNSLIVGMGAVQDFYTRLRAAHPNPDSLPEKVFRLMSPSTLADIPGGALFKAESDLENFFHFILLPPWIQKFQCLDRVRSVDVGLDPAVYGDFVWPQLTTLTMGFVLAPLIAQVAHESVVQASLTRPIRFVHPDALQVAHRRAYGRLREAASEDGTICLSQVPSGFVNATGIDVRVSDLEAFRVPVHIFSLSLAPPDLSPELCITLQGFDLRDGDLEAGMASFVKTHRFACPFAWLLYIDDHHTLMFRCGLDVGTIRALGDWRMLSTFVLYARNGLRPKQSKLRWTSASVTTTLGYMVDLSPQHMSVYVCAAKLAALCERTMILVGKARDARANGRIFAVSVRLLEHVLGSWVWAMMARRCLLSVFQTVFRAVKGRDPSVNVRLREGACVELETAVALAPLCFGRVMPWADVLPCFDASDFGYGVAYRTACPRNVLRELGARVERHGSWSAFSLTVDGRVNGARLRNRDGANARAAADFLKCDWDASHTPWRVARSGEWSLPRPRHITVAETTAAVMTVRWLASQPSVAHARRCLAIGDNQPSLGALAKGRSSIPDVNRLMRQVCALSVTSGLRMSWVWVRSSANPADGPSRRAFALRRHAWVRDLTRECVEPHPGPRSSFSPWKGPVLRFPAGCAPTTPEALRFCSVQPKTRSKYLRAFLAFDFWFHRYAQRCSGTFGGILSDYVFWCFNTGEVCRQQVVDLLSCLSLMEPSLASSGGLRAARRSLVAWGKLVPPKSWLPIPRNVLYGCVVELFARGFVSVAVALLLGFDCYLRHSELIFLRVGDISFQGDFRLLVDDGARVLLLYTKSGRPQHVRIRCLLVVALLRCLVRGRSPKESLFGLKKGALLPLFRKAQRWLGYVDPLFVIHSLRHGGATRDYGLGVSVEDIMVRGRWAGLTVTKRYIQDGQALLLKLEMPAEVAKRLRPYTSSPQMLGRFLGVRRLDM